ncbi:MAG: gliding motility-associated C-terminal domain-containing protein [Phaeodactylibacter sp.]|nr:gliding motility-associated C-terminal domain-containing protein [Phaeodactylibacter sp.]
MGRLYSALFFTFFAGLLQSQSFTKWYTGEDFFFFQSLCPSLDGGLFAQAHSVAEDGSSLLIRTTPEGEPLWSRRYYYQESEVGLSTISEIASAPDGGAWVACQKSNDGNVSNTTFFKVDINGSLLWAHELSQPATFGLDIAAHENDALLAITPNKNNLCLSRLCADGTLLWGKTITLPEYEEYFSCHITLGPGNRTLVHSRVSSQQMTYSLLLSIDAVTGQIAQVQLFDVATLESSAFDTAGNLYLPFSIDGSQHLAKYGPDGAPLWCRQINASIHAVHPSGNDTLNILGSLNGVTTLLNLSSADGSILWSRLYQTAYHTAFSFDGYSTSSVLFPDHHLAWLGRTQDERMTITRISPTGEIADCTTYSPCEITSVSAAFPEFTTTTWIEEALQQHSPVNLSSQSYNLTATPVCDESWFSAGFSNSPELCAGDTLHIHQQPAKFAVHSEWSFVGGTPATSDQPTDTISFSNPGLYDIQHIASAFGCHDTATQFVLVLESPVFNLSPDTSLCTGDSLLIDSGLLPNSYELEWQDGSQKPTFLATTSGSYSLSATNDIGCSRTDSIHVTFTPLPLVALGTDTVLCGKSTLILQPLTDVARPLYAWNTGDDTPQLEANAGYNYTLSVTDATTGCTGQDSIYIGRAEIPQARFPTDTSFCPGIPLLLIVQPQGTEPLDYRWENGESERTLLVMSSGTYTVRVSNGVCDTTATIIISQGNCKAEIYIPNAFSPNDDGINDYFEPFGPGIELQHLQIFNRWGGLLYDEQAADANWDGLCNGEKAAPGVYAFVLEYFNRLEGKAEKATGAIILIR